MKSDGITPEKAHFGVKYVNKVDNMVKWCYDRWLHWHQDDDDVISSQLILY